MGVIAGLSVSGEILLRSVLPVLHSNSDRISTSTISKSQTL